MTDIAHQVLTELLVLRAQAGCGDAVELLVRQWQERLLRHARKLTGCEAAGSDVLQEAWLDVIRGLRNLDDPAKFGPWAYQIVTRRSMRWLRKERRRRRVETVASEQTTTLTDRGHRNADLDESLRLALRRLPADQQMILAFRYAEGYGIQQIADALGIATGTVKSRLFHARQHLRDIIKKVNP
jgi:RNA polymerase sigma-70 factor (ECF subfamily)